MTNGQYIKSMGILPILADVVVGSLCLVIITLPLYGLNKLFGVDKHPQPEHTR